jgi:hypothetical protein
MGDRCKRGDPARRGTADGRWRRAPSRPRSPPGGARAAGSAREASAVSKDEFQAGRDRAFARQDANHDGGLSHDEYVSDFKTRLEAKPATLPADKRDEQRTREMRQVEVRFGVLDSDKNGKITPAEFAYSGWMMFAHPRRRQGRLRFQGRPCRQARQLNAPFTAPRSSPAAPRAGRSRGRCGRLARPAGRRCASRR